MSGTPAFVVHSYQDIQLPSDRAIDWGSFSPRGDYSLDLSSGRINFLMEYSSGNFLKTLMWIGAFLGCLALSFFLSGMIWEARETKGTQEKTVAIREEIA